MFATRLIWVVMTSSFFKVSADGATVEFRSFMNPFRLIVEHSTEAVDILLDLSSAALVHSPIKCHTVPLLIKFTKSINKELYGYMRELYELSAELSTDIEMDLTDGAVKEIAQMYNHTAVLKNALTDFNSTVANLRQGSSPNRFKLMPVGPPRIFLIVKPIPPEVRDPDFPMSGNTNLEELLTNVEEALGAKRWIFEFIQGTLVDLWMFDQIVPKVPKEIINSLHTTLFNMLELIKSTARSHNLVVDDLIVAESARLRKLAVAIEDAMIALDIYLYGYGFGYAPLVYKVK